jgi:small ligand-binding sensory domain FIST
MTFRSAHAAADDWRECAARCLTALEPLPAGANLGFLYATDVFAPHLAAILDHFKEHTGVESWVGSVGVGICGLGREYYEQGALSVLVGRLPRGSFRVFQPLLEDTSELYGSHAEWLKHSGARFAVVHGDPRNPQTPQLIADLSQALDGGFLVGGITSSRGDHYQIADEITEGGLSGVLFAPEVAVASALTQGCTPFGAEHEITDCRHNIIITLDNRPALDVFNDEVGEEIARDPDLAAGYIFVGLPVHGSDTGDYLVRNLIGIDPENRLLAIGEQPERGDRLRFCRRDQATAREDLKRMLRDLRSRAGRAPHAAVYYSCLGRGQYTFGRNSEELALLRQELGDVPLAGFFANGEISNCRLYGYTGVLTLFL